MSRDPNLAPGPLKCHKSGSVSGEAMGGSGNDAPGRFETAGGCGGGVESHTGSLPGEAIYWALFIVASNWPIMPWIWPMTHLISTTTRAMMSTQAKSVNCHHSRWTLLK